MSSLISPVDAARTWLERIMTSSLIGFVVRDESGALMQCVDGDPELRLALIEWQTQRIRELAHSEGKPTRPVSYPTLGDYIDPSLAGLAPEVNTDTDLSTPTFPGS